MDQPTTLGDDATDSLYQRYAATIFMYLRQHTLSREDAEDLLVDTFLAALSDQKFAQLPEQAQVAWLWRVARNKVIDGYRRSHVRRSIPLEQIAETIYEDEAHSPEQCALRLEEEERIKSMLAHLSAEQQEIMQLRFGHDLRCAEIADVVGKNEAAVRTALSRAMNFLRNRYRGKER